MNIWDIVILALLAAAVLAAIAVIVKNKKRGKCACGGDCAHCANRK